MIGRHGPVVADSAGTIRSGRSAARFRWDLAPHSPESKFLISLETVVQRWIGGGYSAQTYKVSHLAERHLVHYCLTRHDKNFSFIDLGGRGRDANVKRSANIAGPDNDDATKAETQGTADPNFSPATGSTNAVGHNSKQQSWSEKRNR